MERRYEWNKDLSVGVQTLDQDHQSIFDTFNEFYVVFMSGGSKEQLLTTLQKLQDYCVRHFEAEEKWLESEGDPCLAQQRKQHHIFTEEIENLISDLRAGRRASTTSANLCDVLEKWFRNHIMSLDQKYAIRIMGTAGLGSQSDSDRP